jgi:hypothetical protein
MTVPKTPFVSSTMSFTGSAQRIWRGLGENEPKALFGTLAISLIAVAWCFVVCWYVILYGLFGIFFIPFRLLTRGQRKTHRNQVLQMQQQAMLFNFQQQQLSQMQAQGQVSSLQPPQSEPLVSPDGNYLWDGNAWQPRLMASNGDTDAVSPA